MRGKRRGSKYLSQEMSGTLQKQSLFRCPPFPFARCRAMVFALLENCGKLYRMAPDHIKKLLNQAIFDRIWIDEDDKAIPEMTPACKDAVEANGVLEKSASAAADADSVKNVLRCICLLQSLSFTAFVGK